jgi:GNAT superfamily N-acetyltransferase
MLARDRLYGMIMRQVRQTWVSYGLKRDLDLSHRTPASSIAISIRELQESDIPLLFSGTGNQSGRYERLEIARRLQHLAAKIPTCYVAVEQATGVPCFIQWLMRSESNDEIQRFFKGRFPLLRDNEALLENAYTPPAFRGLGIMSAAMADIAERGREQGCRYVITFVQRENTASLKGCAKAGFYPYLIRRDSQVLFRLLRRRTFELLAK